MKNEFEIKELNEMELDGIAAGRVIYACTSDPIVGENGSISYRVFSGDGKIEGDVKQFFSGKGASTLSGSLSFSFGTVNAKKYAAYCKFHANDEIIEF